METVYTTWGKSSICSAMVGPLGAMCGRPAPPLLSLWMVARSVSHGCQVGAAVSAPFLSLPPFPLWTDIRWPTWMGRCVVSDLPASRSIGCRCLDRPSVCPSLRHWMTCPQGDERSVLQTRPPLVAWLPRRDCRPSPRRAVSCFDMRR